MKHQTVLLKEAIEYLNIKNNGIYVDGTLGGGGHSKLILDHLEDGFLYAFDQDEFAIEYAHRVLKDKTQFLLIKNNFRHIKQALNEQSVLKVDGILLDLGLSSFQIDDEKRGFTYLKDTTLDMRMDQSGQVTAQDILNTYEFNDLAKLMFLYGEEKNSFKIAHEIIKNRPLSTTMDVVKITDKINYKDKGHSAKRVFQALRIAINDELGALEKVLKDGLELLNPGGRMVVITFHSLEDRIVKHYFKEMSSIHIPKNIPMQHLPEADYKMITPKPVYPSEDEIKNNSRSRSAKMRVIERIR